MKYIARLEAKIAKSKEKLAAIESMLHDCQSELGKDSSGAYEMRAESVYKKRLKKLLNAKKKFTSNHD